MPQNKSHSFDRELHISGREDSVCSKLHFCVKDFQKGGVLALNFGFLDEHFLTKKKILKTIFRQPKIIRGRAIVLSPPQRERALKNRRCQEAVMCQ